MPDGPNPGQSYEAWVESMAGACPPCDTGGHDDSCTCSQCYPDWGNATPRPIDWPPQWDWPMPRHGGAGDEDEATPDE